MDSVKYHDKHVWKDYNLQYILQFCQTELIERKKEVMSSYGWLQTSVTSEN